MKNAYTLTLLISIISSSVAFGQSEQSHKYYSTDGVAASGWVKIKDSETLGTRTASIQANSSGVTLTDWYGVFKIGPNGGHIDVTPRQGSNWTYGVSRVYNDTLFVPARYLSYGQGTDSSKVFISDDNGISWLSEDGPVFSSASIQLNSDLRFYSDTMYLMGDDELFFSADLGKTWTDISPVNIGCDAVNDIFYNNGQLYLTGCSVGRVFRLQKSSGTWVSDISFPVGDSNRFMKRDSVVFLTAPDLIERKYPSSTSWQQATNGLLIFHVYEHFNLNQNLFICTSVGVFKTEDYGNNWSDFNNGWLDPMNINPVNMAVFGDTLFVASHSEGVYKQAIPAKSISINELSKASESVKLYPNPATDNITIALKDASGGTYKILDQGGKLLASGSFENGEKLVLPNLAEGLYIISIEGSNNTYVKKLKIGK